jgi:hypothetical protein
MKSYLERIRNLKENLLKDFTKEYSKEDFVKLIQNNIKKELNSKYNSTIELNIGVVQEIIDDILQDISIQRKHHKRRRTTIKLLDKYGEDSLEEYDKKYKIILRNIQTLKKINPMNFLQKGKYYNDIN